MFVSWIVYGLPFLLAPVIIIAAIAVIHERRVAKKSTYYRVREAARRGVRLWSLVGILAIVAVVIALLSRSDYPPPTLRPATPSPGLEYSVISLPDTPTLNPTLTEKSLFEAPATITPTRPAPTPSPTAPIATLAVSVTPPEDASLTIMAISSAITADLKPLDPGQSFPAGITRLYFFYAYEGMADGMSWSRVLVLGDQVIRNETEAWADGSSGEMYYWFSAPDGWQAGSYEIRFYAGERLLASAFFTIGG